MEEPRGVLRERVRVLPEPQRVGEAHERRREGACTLRHRRLRAPPRRQGVQLEGDGVAGGIVDLALGLAAGALQPQAWGRERGTGGLLIF